MATEQRVAILGATGPTGRLLVVRALAQGHRVTAIARRVDRLGLRHAALSVFAKDLTVDDAALAGLLGGHDVAICALGRGRSFRSHHLLARAVPRLLAALQQAGVSRLVFLSAYGVSDSSGVPALARFFFRTLLAGIYADKAEAEALVEASPLRWSIVAPVMLTDGPSTGRWQLAERPALSGLPRVSRADLADALLRVAADPATERRRLVLSAAANPHPAA